METKLRDVKVPKKTLMRVVCLLACACLCIGMAFVPAHKAQALESVPTRVTEADLSSGKINGKNWMSGISGSLRLHEISIPGTHDSGMANASFRTQVFEFVPGLNAAPEIGKMYARTQNLEIDEQLDAGVRLLDMRVTDTKPDAKGATKGDGGLWVCHGQNTANRLLSFVTYSFVPKNKQTNGEGYLTYDKVLRYCTDFLRKHPTKTIIMQVAREYKSGDDAVIWQRANTITNRWTKAINPSTGKPYIYKQPNTGDDWHITVMPTLEDTRGQIVLATSDVKQFNYGMHLNAQNTWTTFGTVADVRMSYENHYECDRFQKVNYVQDFYRGKTTGKSQDQFPAQRTNITGAQPYNVRNALFVNASSNGFTTANGTPSFIAKHVNAKLFTDKNAFFNDTRGTHIGWLNTDFVTEPIAKKIWIANYPKGGLEYCTITFKTNQNEIQKKIYTVQRGTAVRLPQSMFGVPNGSGLEFLGWDVEGADLHGLQQPGTTIRATGNSATVTATYAQTWRSVAQLINGAQGKETTTITLKNDIKATNLDTALSIAKDKNIVINLNGHTINRNDSTSSSVGSKSDKGSAIVNAGNLTINGPGTITGGSAVEGGGINVTSGSVTLKDVIIRDNYASRAGGGVYVRSGKCSFAVSGSTRIQNNHRVDSSNNRVDNNVHLGTNSPNGDAVIRGIDSLQDGIVVGVSCSREPTPTSPTPITERLSDNADQAKNLLTRLKSECDYGIELGTNNQAVFKSAYKVTFNTMGAGTVATQFVKSGGKVTEPAKLEKTGASFIGWYPAGSNQKYDFNEPVTKNLDLVASWDAYVRTVSFDSTNGSPVQSQLIEYGKLAMEPEVPTREGYDFTGWKIDIGGRHGANYVPYHFDEPVTRDITPKAGWKIQEFSVVFKNENAEYARQTVEYGKKVTRPANPTREGAWFEGWQVEHATGLYNFDHPVDTNLVLVAQWKQVPTHKVTFQPHANNVSNLPSEQWVTHGQKATAPTSAPTREGYTFKGWYRSALYGGGAYDFNQPVNNEVNLYAQWEATSHTVTFDANAGSDTVANMPATQTVKHDEYASKPRYEPRRTGYYFTGWKLGDTAYGFSEKVTSNITLKAQWGIIRYTLFFRPNAVGVTGMPANAEQDYGKTWTRPADPTRPGYTFGGWYTDKECTDGNMYDFNTPVAHSREVFAKWTKASHTVTFDGDGGGDTVTGVPEPTSVEHGAKVAKPADPSREGYVFAGWYKDNVPYDFDAVVMGDVALKAHWVQDQENKFVVVFDSDGGSEVDAQLVDKNGVATKPVDPTRDGYDFQGWFTYEGYDGNTTYDFSTQVTNHLVLYAKWAPTIQRHTVTFDKADGSTVSTVSVEHGSAVAEPGEAPIRDDYVFAGWFAEENLYDFYAPVISDLTLTAHWEPIPYSVEFDSAGGSDVGSQFVYQGGKATRPGDPTRDGYGFAGWYAGDNLYDFNTAVTGNLTLTAHWVKLSYLVEFSDPEGGFTVDPQVVDGGERASQPDPAPQLEGYDFNGWCLSGTQNAYDFTTPVNSSLMLVAKWTRKTYEVTFDSAGGTQVTKQVVNHGDKATKPADPQKDHSLFGGWHADGDPFDFTKPITANVALMAWWNPVMHKVTFDANGGTPVPDEQSVAYGKYASKPDADPTKENAVFDGWYYDVELAAPITAEEAAAIENDPEQNPWIWVISNGGGYTVRYEYGFGVDESDKITQDITLHARWKSTTHTVSFNANGGQNAPAAQSVPNKSQATEPDSDPTWTGHYFTGWYTNAAGNGEPFDFDTAITGNLVLYAGWKPEEYIVTFLAGDGSVSDDQLVAYNTKVTPPANPTREGYTFQGWFTNENLSTAFDFEQPITDDAVVYAKWKANEYTVTFDADRGTPEPNKQQCNHGELANRPETDPTKEGSIFAGWYVELPNDLDDDTAEKVREDSELSHDYWVTDDDFLRVPYDFNYPVEGDITLYARWLPQSCTVSFDANGGVRQPDEQSVNYGALVNKPADDPIKAGYLFKGWWVLEDEALDSQTADEIRYNADFEDIYWVTDDNKLYEAFDFANDVVYEDMTLYARWQPIANKVTFVDDTGAIEYEQEVLTGETPTEIYGGTDESYAFGGWFADEARSSAYDFTQPITSDTTIYGKWTPQVYIVTFDSNGGSAVTPQSQQVPYEGLAQKPADPQRDGFVFLGWYADFSDVITPDGLAELKAEVAEFLKSAEASAETDVEIVEEVQKWQQAVDESYVVIDGKVMARYNPESDHVYSDVKAQAQWREGSVTTEVVLGDGVPAIKASNLDDVAQSIVTAKEKSQGVVVQLRVNKIDPADASDADRSALQAKLGELGASDSMWLDISLYKIVGGVETKIEKVDTPLKLSMEIPAELRASQRTFYLIRAHEGEAAVVGTGSGETLAFETDRFSTYTLGSKDSQQPSPTTNPRAQSTSTRASTPKTGDGLASGPASLIGMLCIVAAGALFVVARKYRE